MRLKFFAAIFIVLAIAAMSTSYIHYHFFNLERLRLIELNLQQNANLLSHSDLNNLTRSEFIIRGKNVIENIIGDDKVNMILAIYGKRGNILYKNENAVIFEVPDKISTTFTEWEDVETNDYLIKYLTVRDDKQERIIKVGMILNQSLLRWKYLNQRILIFVLIILGVVTVISFFLTYILFRPVQRLAEQVNQMSMRIERGEFSDLKPRFMKMKGEERQKDEFQRLLISLDKLANKIIESQMLTQKWSALMAHELKTPMTILRNSMESLLTEVKDKPEKVQAVESELENLEKIIMDFLDWASVENDASRPEIHVIALNKRCERLVKTFKATYPSAEINYEYKSQSEKKIFCNPLHFDQVINNLLVNALKYGNQSRIEIELEDQSISIKDYGSGIPDVVIENFGKPFNKYLQGTVPGFGLGLAWVNTIAKKYEWKIQINNLGGTKFRITFPEIIDS